MQGRIENELKIEKHINELLSDMPAYVKEWYINLKASKKTMASCENYITKIKNFLNYLNPNVKDVSPCDITIDKVELYFISIQTKMDKNGEPVHTSDSYQQTVWFALNNFFTFLKKRNYISENFMESIDKPKNKDLNRIQEERILLTQKDFNKIIRATKKGAGTHRAKAFQDKLKNRDMLIMLLFMTTGMRKTALSEINIQDINLDTYTLKIVDKGNKTHYYPLGEIVQDYLDLWLIDREDFVENDNDALFITTKGDRLTSSSISKLVEKYCEEGLGYKISPHKLRSGFCSILYNKTHDVEFVRRTVGHSNIATTQRYIKTDGDEKERAVKIISDSLRI